MCVHMVGQASTELVRGYVLAVHNMHTLLVMMLVQYYVVQLQSVTSSCRSETPSRLKNTVLYVVSFIKKAFMINDD
jgi:hypothetical protein